MLRVGVLDQRERTQLKSAEINFLFRDLEINVCKQMQNEI